MGQSEMAVEPPLECGPGSRVRYVVVILHTPTVRQTSLQFEMSMMNEYLMYVAQKHHPLGLGQAHYNPCRGVWGGSGGKLRRPKDLREGGHGSDWKPREDLGPS